MRSAGIILALAGLLALIYGGFTYTKQNKVLDVGPLEAKVDEKKTVAVPPIAGAIVLISGVVLILSDRKRSVA